VLRPTRIGFYKPKTSDQPRKDVIDVFGKGTELPVSWNICLWAKLFESKPCFSLLWNLLLFHTSLRRWFSSLCL